MVLGPIKHIVRVFLNGFKIFLENLVSKEFITIICFCEGKRKTPHTNEGCFIS